jgi:hypothetical protein
MKFSIDTFFIPVRGYFPPKMYVYDDKKKIILYAAKLVNLDNNLFAASWVYTEGLASSQNPLIKLSIMMVNCWQLLRVIVYAILMDIYYAG